MKISKRLSAVAGEIKYKTAADIGCDHAYALIYAMLNSKIDAAYACDINEKPLIRARENISRHNLSDKIKTKRGDGLAAIEGLNTETVIIAGLGGHLTVEILERGHNFIPGIKQLILQPMSEVPKVRRYINRIGFMISNESIVYEDLKYYNIIVCEPGSDAPYDETENEFGRALINKKDEIFIKYLNEEARKIKNILSGFNLNGDVSLKTRERIGELENILRMAEGILNA